MPRHLRHADLTSAVLLVASALRTRWRTQIDPFSGSRQPIVQVVEELSSATLPASGHFCFPRCLLTLAQRGPNAPRRLPCAALLTSADFAPRAVGEAFRR